jgi:hypothetical protein
VSEVKHLSSIVALKNEPRGLTLQSPDPERTKLAEDNQRKLESNLRIYCNAQERVTAGFKRLSMDLKQVTNTIQVIRESFKVLETMEGLLAQEFNMKT